MFKKLQGVDLVPEYTHSKAKLYRLDADKLFNKYYIVTSASTRHLLNSPEVVGFENYDRMCNPTKTTLDFFNKKGLITAATFSPSCAAASTIPWRNAAIAPASPSTI